MTDAARHRRRRRPGLGARLALALVLASVTTLATAMAAMIPLLEHRLESERLSELRDLARTVRPDLTAVPVGDLEPHSRALQLIVEHLQRRTGGHVAVYDEGDRVLAQTAPVVPGSPFVVPASARARALRDRERLVSGELGDEAYAVVLARDGPERITLVLDKPLDERRSASQVVRSVLPLALLAGVAVAVVLAFLLSGGLLRRLGRLRADAGALGRDGLDHPVAVRGTDEVAEVARALEDMRRRLVEQETSRQAFVATASHELRTPLASLQVTLELLREEVARDAVDAAGVTARADAALRQTHRLVGLATDLLDLSRLDGGADLRPEPLELGEVVRGVSYEFEAPLQRAGRALTVEGGPALALADPAAVARILRVLLENAGSYGAGDVAVSIARVDGRVTLAVADAGPGVEPGERERIFLRFTRGSAAGGGQGAGLGLAIARGLARMMGGDVGVVLGAGARFVVTLPAWDPGSTEPQPDVEVR